MSRYYTSLSSVLFVLGCFSIKPLQNLDRFYQYGYFKIEEPNGYGYHANLAVKEAHNANKVLRMFYGNKN